MNENNKCASLYKVGMYVWSRRCMEERTSDKFIEKQENVKRTLLLLLHLKKKQMLPDLAASGVYIVMVMETLNSSLNKLWHKYFGGTGGACEVCICGGGGAALWREPSPDRPQLGVDWQRWRSKNKEVTE